MIRQAVAALLRRAADAFDPEEEPPRQRQRTEEGSDDDATATPPASLNSVSDQCLLRILSFLPTDDLNNNVALVSQRFRVARNNESLDQTRTATIVLTKGFTFADFYCTVASKEWNQRLQGNYSRLKIVGVHKLEALINESEELKAARGVDCKLTGVTSLDLSANPGADNPRMGHWSVAPLVRIFPNLKEANFSYLKINRPDDLIWGCFLARYSIARLVWNGCSGYSSRGLGGIYAIRDTSIRELSMDGSHFHVSSNDEIQTFSNPTANGDQDYMFHWYYSIQRLSIKNITWSVLDQGDVNPVSQDMLIKLVRRHRSLCWLRSDLTDENIAMLKQERPYITCVR